MQHWDVGLTGEDLADGSGVSTSTTEAPSTFSTIENALNWLLESPGTRDLRVAALSKERPDRHVIGHFTLDPNLEGSASATDESNDQDVLGPPSPGSLD